ncbi:MAG: endo alpha-1,4 polygalactosaminidase [Rhodobacteraceae bacterium]|nr:endo alpha-1,4 polygalactosaminidase [Paracoccaceae bacterium]
MPLFNTSTGQVEVANWGYQLQDSPGLDATTIANASHDLIVMDFSSDGTGVNRFTLAEIAAIKDGPGGRSVAVSYLSIGEASEFRDHWDASWTSSGLASGDLTDDAPGWLGATNPDWPESRKVRYWEDEWQDVIFNDAGTGWLDQIVAQGFDAAYLDIVDAYYYWAVEAPNKQREPGDPARNDEMDAAGRMIDFIVDMTAHARLTTPDFFVIMQNGEFIIDALEGTDPARKAALLDAIGAIAVEDTYFTGAKAEDNRLNPDSDKINILQSDFLGNDIPVFVVDYLSNPDKIDDFRGLVITDGFIPYAAHDRDLANMDAPMGGGDATENSDYLVGGAGRDVIKARKGNDVVEGLGGNDTLKGGLGRDRLFGNDGQDRLFGNAGKDHLNGGDGQDRLFGGAGRDRLTGGEDADRFIFRAGSGQDKVLDFQDGMDVIVVDDALWTGTRTAAEVLNEFGTQDGNHFELDFGSGDILFIRHATSAQLLDDFNIV